MDSATDTQTTDIFTFSQFNLIKTRNEVRGRNRNVENARGKPNYVRNRCNNLAFFNITFMVIFVDFWGGDGG